jgi:hypothetical protein
MIMRYFFGAIRGSGTQSTNSGTMSSGLNVQAMSRQGAVCVWLHEQGGVDMARIWLAANPKTGKGSERLLYDGPVAGLSIAPMHPDHHGRLTPDGDGDAPDHLAKRVDALVRHLPDGDEDVAC